MNLISTPYVADVLEADVKLNEITNLLDSVFIVSSFKTDQFVFI